MCDQNGQIYGFQCIFREFVLIRKENSFLVSMYINTLIFYKTVVYIYSISTINTPFKIFKVSIDKNLNCTLNEFHTLKRLFIFDNFLFLRSWTRLFTFWHCAWVDSTRLKSLQKFFVKSEQRWHWRSFKIWVHFSFFRNIFSANGDM